MDENSNDRRIDYLEFIVRDIARTKAFYGSAFGWSFTDYGPNYTSFFDGRFAGGFTTDGEMCRGRRFHFIDPDGYELAMWSEERFRA